MGLNIILPLLALAIIVPVAFVWAKKNLKDGAGAGLGDDAVTAPADRLTSNAFRDIPSPPWRVVYEIAPDKLSGIGHVLIGPGGIFAVQTEMTSLPEPPTEAPDARVVGQAAVARGGLDDALQRCAMSSEALVTIHWGINERDEHSLEVVPAHYGVDGRQLDAWLATLGDKLQPSQIDLAWQTVVTAIGRPDPLA